MKARICTRSGVLYTTENCRCPRCTTTTRTDNRRRAQKTKTHGLNRRSWRTRTRPNILTRDNHQCRLGLPGCTHRATTVHRIPTYGPNHDNNPDAYLSACHHCHGTIDAPRATRP